jgi:hypothetical protein
VIDKIILLLWLGLVIAWNYLWPEASPFEDVFVAVCFMLFSRSLIKELA